MKIKNILEVPEISAVNNDFSGYLDFDEISAPANPASNVGRLYVADDGGDTKIYFKDSAGTAYDLTSGGSGDVTKVGTPANDQIGVWTGDGTIEGDADLTFDGSDLTCTGVVNATTFDTNVAAAGMTMTGTTIAVDGTDANIDITLTPKGAAGIVIGTGVPGTTTNKLYNSAGSLYWNGTDLTAGGGAFSTTSNVTSNAPGTLGTDDFVFGSDDLDDDGDATHDSRFFFDKSKSYFYAGKTNLFAQTEEVNRGSYTANFGAYNTAKGSYSLVAGFSCENEGAYNIACGYNVSADSSSSYSAVFGTNCSLNSSSTRGLAFGDGCSITSSAYCCAGGRNSAISSSPYTFVFGYNSSATDSDFGAAIGENVDLDGLNSFGIGQNIAINCNYGMAFAHNATLDTTDYYSVALGNEVNPTQARVIAYAGGHFDVNGDLQTELWSAGIATTNDTTTALKIGNYTNGMDLPASTSFVIKGTVQGITQDCGAASSWDVVAHVVRDASNNTTLLYSNVTALYDNLGGGGSATVAFAADDTSEEIDINVTGIAATNIRWGAALTVNIVAYPAP